MMIVQQAKEVNRDSFHTAPCVRCVIDRRGEVFENARRAELTRVVAYGENVAWKYNNNNSEGAMR